MDLATLLLWIGFILVLLAAFRVSTNKVELLALGIACCIASVIVPPVLA